MISRARTLLVGASIALSFVHTAAHAEPRFALLIADGTYPDAGKPREAAGADADSLDSTLSADGFDTSQELNLDKRAMRAALDAFLAKITPGATALLYFNGFGLQVRGQTFLLPTDAEIWTEADVARNGVSLAAILADMAKRGAKAKIAIVDAARENPFERRFRSTPLGLAPPALPPNTLVIYNAEPGALGAGDAPFMDRLVDAMDDTTLTATQAFNQARLAVARETKMKQAPWVASSLARFAFAAPAESGGRPYCQSRFTGRVMHWGACQGQGYYRPHYNRRSYGVGGGEGGGGGSSDITGRGGHDGAGGEGYYGGAGGGGGGGGSGIGEGTRGAGGNGASVAGDDPYPDQPQTSQNENAHLPGEVSTPTLAPTPPPVADDTPQFPWPPPAPSTSYQIPNSLFGKGATMGAVAETIGRALDSAGYAERRFYALPVPGIALATRLERCNTDGSPGAPRWQTKEEKGLLDLLRGLFFTDPGHYRVIVFLVTKEPPGRTPADVPIDEARGWLKGGLDVVPKEAGATPYGDGTTLAYIYDFVSDGEKFTLDREPLPGKDQLTRAGVLTALGAAGH